ncbi:endosome-associated-trafficking regulator 1 isoform X2 [Varanus komodoensis]|uniref:endosome-associated-trafficking regulator 1 isoform X2 n=1 Tax=Varanus komodoensis TaxID=61221 RepID=UPI001CF7E688|nr:endosome-associated-trafficking regulator 1 isoform X2 [Varanus komodoensis]
MCLMGWILEPASQPLLLAFTCAPASLLLLPVGPPSCSGEEANPFSFKEFVRSKNQAATTSTLPGAQRTSELLRELRLTSGISPQESSGFSPLDNSSLSPQSFGLSLDLREPFFPDPTVTNSLLDDEEDDWSTTYQPLAVEEAHSTRGPSASLSSTSDSLYSNRSDVSDLGSFSAWQLGGNGSQPQGPLGKGDPSSPQDGVATGDGFLPSPQLSYEELKQENSKLRSMIAHIETVSETQTARVKLLERTLEESKRKEEKEARDLEAMVQQVEENLQLMTKRAVKAESSVIKLKQENVLLQAQVESFKLEKETLRAGHSANVALMKRNVDVALQNLLAVVTKSRSSVQQLISGAEELQLVAEFLKSIGWSKTAAAEAFFTFCTAKI